MSTRRQFVVERIGTNAITPQTQIPAQTQASTDGTGTTAATTTAVVAVAATLSVATAVAYTNAVAHNHNRNTVKAILALAVRTNTTCARHEPKWPTNNPRCACRQVDC